MPAAAMATSAFGGELYPGRSDGVFVEDVEGCQADVGDFFLSKHHRRGFLRRHSAAWNG
jgi:hypothetical protein